jgi:hypothetical protein
MSPKAALAKSGDRLKIMASLISPAMLVAGLFVGDQKARIALLVLGAFLLMFILANTVKRVGRIELAFGKLLLREVVVVFSGNGAAWREASRISHGADVDKRGIKKPVAKDAGTPSGSLRVVREQPTGRFLFTCRNYPAAAMQKNIVSIEPSDLLSGSHYYVRISCKASSKVPGHVLIFRLKNSKDEWLKDETKPSKPFIYARRKVASTTNAACSVVLGPVSSLQASNVSIESEEGPIGERNGFEITFVEVAVLEPDLDVGTA